MAFIYICNELSCEGMADYACSYLLNYRLLLLYNGNQVLLAVKKKRGCSIRLRERGRAPSPYLTVQINPAVRPWLTVHAAYCSLCILPRWLIALTCARCRCSLPLEDASDRPASRRRRRRVSSICRRDRSADLSTSAVRSYGISRKKGCTIPPPFPLPLDWPGCSLRLSAAPLELASLRPRRAATACMGYHFSSGLGRAARKFASSHYFFHLGCPIRPNLNYPLPS